MKIKSLKSFDNFFNTFFFMMVTTSTRLFEKLVKNLQMYFYKNNREDMHLFKNMHLCWLIHEKYFRMHQLMKKSNYWNMASSTWCGFAVIFVFNTRKNTLSLLRGVLGDQMIFWETLAIYPTSFFNLWNHLKGVWIETIRNSAIFEWLSCVLQHAETLFKPFFVKFEW